MTMQLDPPPLSTVYILQLSHLENLFRYRLCLIILAFSTTTLSTLLE